MAERAYKTEMAPTKEQKEFLGRCAGAQRVTYNWALDQCQIYRAQKEPGVRSALGAIASVDGFDELFREVLRVEHYPSGKATSDDSEDAKAKKKDRQSVASKCSDFLKDRCAPHLEVIERDTILLRNGAIDVILTAGRTKSYDDDVAKWKAAGSKKEEKPRRPYIRIRSLDFNNLKKQWRAFYRKPANGYGWMQDVPSSVIDSAFNHLFEAYKRFYAYLRNGGTIKIGPPKSHKRHANESFTVISQPNGLDVKRSKIRLPNIGWLRLKERGYLPVGKTTRLVTVSSEGGKWFVSVIGTFEPEQLPAGRPSVGIDVGIVHYAILQPRDSDVERVDNHKFFESGMKRLGMLQRRCARKQGPVVRRVTMFDGSERIVPEGHVYVAQARHDGRSVKIHRQKPSRRWERMRQKINRQHYRIACRRRNFQHELSTSLVRRFGEISVETLGIQDMIRRHGKKTTNRRLRRLIGDASWYEFRRQLTYKGEWYGSNVESVNRWYPSTQECSKCRTTTEVNWHDRKCRCPKCGFVIDMDDNAAENLLKEMLRPLNEKHGAAD